MATNKTIILRGDPNIIDEFKAAAAITPGDLVEKTSTAGVVQKHGTAAKNAARLFAIERDELGKDIDDNYATNDQVKIAAVAPGDEVMVRIANLAPAIVQGDFLESAGDGTLRKLVTDAATDDTQRVSVVAVALEAVDVSGGGGPARIRALIV